MYSAFGLFRICSILIATMHSGFRAIVVGFLLSIPTGVILARAPLTISTDQPVDYNAVERDLSSVDSYLNGAKCGGYDLDESVEGKVATLARAPGRPAEWDGNILLGMGTREDVNANGNPDDDFRFPTTTLGLTTACESYRNLIQKPVWKPGGTRPDEIVPSVATFTNPYFGNPSCRWRVQTGENSWSDTAPSIPLTGNEQNVQFSESQVYPNDRQSPESCNNFCSYLNTWQYRQCMETAVIPDPNDPNQLYPICVRWAALYLCTDQEVTTSDPSAPCRGASPDKANSILCTGQSCRCQEDGGPENLNGCVANPGTQPNESPQYYSYMRRYDASITRNPVPSDGPTDNTLSDQTIPIGCYGFYDEFDPKTRATTGDDRRCVINVDVSDMRESQVGKGEFGDKDSTVDPDPLDEENQRIKTDSAKDIWYMKLGHAFSLLNEKSFEEDFGKSLSQVYLDTDSLDDTKLTGSWPVAKEDEDPRLADSETLRAFDDTGDKRTVASWWQKQQTDVSTLLHPPVVRLLLPATYAFSNDPSDPLFSLPKTVSYDPYDKRTQRVEVQIDAQEDTLGQVLKTIERSLLLHLEEDPVPVVVPSGSPTEYRARAEEWCVWVMKQNGTADCDNAPQDVQLLMDRLHEYADRIDDVRTLRNALSTYAAKALDLQQQLRNPIQQWINENLQEYRDYLQRQRELSENIATSWRSAQEAMSTFANRTNLPWCMNQRFTSPIYSLLDDWLPARKRGGSVTADDLPNLTAKRAKDIVIDFSGVSTFTEALSLPVLKPIQVTLQIPTTSETIEKPLPALPSMTGIAQALEQTLNKLPKVQTTGELPELQLPELDTDALTAAVGTIDKIKETVDGMNDRYDKFWKSIGPLSSDDTDDSRDSIKSMKEKLECKFWDDQTCQHVEMDLMERLQRIASRKMVFLQEDYESQGQRRGSPDACTPEDTACLLMHGETTSTYLWQIDGPTNVPDLGSDARSRVRDLLFPYPIGTVNEEDVPPYKTDFTKILPAFDVPPAIDLDPDPDTE